MDIRRLVLYTALGLVMYSLWTKWQQDYPAPARPAVITSQTVATSNDGSLLPNMPENKVASISNGKQPEADNDVTSKQASQLLNVKTDVMSLNIDTRHGDIVNAELLKYPVSAENPDNPITLLYDQPEHRYVANTS